MDKTTAVPSDPQPRPRLSALLFKTIQTLLIAVIALVLWPFYALGRLLWERPPNVVHLSQAKRYLHLTWTVDPPAPGISWQARIWLTLGIVRQLLLIPVLGFAWQLDEWLYGRRLNAASVVAPFFVISGGRSGSTQITRYLEEDSRLTAPNLLQCLLPYLWLWKIAPPILGRLFPPDKVRARIEALMPPELLERHELDPFKADTFDGAFLSGLNPLAFYLGPSVLAEEFNFATFTPPDKALMEQKFVRFVDRIGRKQQLFSGASPSDTPQRLYIKGHFLYAAAALAAHYPDATFLTVIRDPAARLQSGINYMRVNPVDPAIGPPPWAWLTPALRQTESDYCRVEQAWYTQEDDIRRCVIRFADFVADLEGSLRAVYRVCFDEEELPPHVPRTHPPRERTNYTVNYSLAELGLDAAELRAELADYVAWCQPTHELVETS